MFGASCVRNTGEETDHPASFQDCNRDLEHCTLVVQHSTGDTKDNKRGNHEFEIKDCSRKMRWM